MVFAKMAQDSKIRLSGEQRKILEKLSDTFENAAFVAQDLNIDQSAVMSAMSYFVHEKLAELEEDAAHVAELTEEGKGYAAGGTPEERLAADRKSVV